MPLTPLATCRSPLQATTTPPSLPRCVSAFLSLCSKVVNVTPRYAKLHSSDGSEILGWENIELISDRPFDTMVRRS